MSSRYASIKLADELFHPYLGGGWKMLGDIQLADRLAERSARQAPRLASILAESRATPVSVFSKNAKFSSTNALLRNGAASCSTCHLSQVFDVGELGLFEDLADRLEVVRLAHDDIVDLSRPHKC